MTLQKRLLTIIFMAFALALFLVAFCGCQPLVNLEHTIGNDYFDIIGNTSVHNEDGSISVKLTAVCALPVYEYTYSLTIYDEAKETIYKTEDITVEKELDAEKEFSIEVLLPKDVAEKYSYHLLDLSGITKENPAKLENNSYKITYICNGVAYKTENVQGGGTITVTEGQACENLFFEGWYKNEGLTIHANATDKIYRNKTYYAKYTLDAESVTNKLTTEYMQGLVSITCEKNSLSSSSGAGSGAIFKVEGNKYYVVTNAHVLSSSSVYVTDCYGNKKSGVIVSKSDSYDLGIVTFRSDKPLKVLSLATEGITAYECCISLGYPKLQKNAITYGRVERYTDTSGDNSMAFQVIQHSAIVTSGCSGGPLLNAQFQIVGINFAKANDGEEFTTGFAIPIVEVRRFIINSNIALD